LIKDRKLWMDILRKTQPYFEFLSKLLKDEDFTENTDDANRNFAKGYFDLVEKNEDYCSQNIIKIFKRIQMIRIVLQDGIEGCPVYEVFQKEFIGKKLAVEIQLQIDRAEKEKEDPDICFESRFAPGVDQRFAWLFEKSTQIKTCRNGVKQRKEMNEVFLLRFGHLSNELEEMLELREQELKIRQEQLLLGVKITLFPVKLSKNEITKFMMNT
jgi:hypothetical protein